MAKLWQSLFGRESVTRYSLDEYLADLSSARNNLILSYGSSAWTKSEDIENSFTGYVQQIYKSDGVVFAVMLARQLLFSEARFMWQELNDGRPGDLFWSPELELLDHPWPNATTGEMLVRMDQDVSLAGNAYVVREEGRLRRLQPDWLTIVLTAPPAEAVQSDVAGYWYHPGRTYSNVDQPQPEDGLYLPDEMCHWSPIPDPEAQYRGMSWLTPVVREVMADKAATLHKERFFANGATLGPVISSKENLSAEQFTEWVDNLDRAHSGVMNAYKPLYMASPVDVKATTADLRQLDFKITQGAGESRIAAAGGVPPIIVGLSEGLQYATYSNYGSARRKMGDHWARPQWRSVSAALSSLMGTPERSARLWYDDRDIAFLREDQKDAAEIDRVNAATIVSLSTGGFTRKSAITAVASRDMTLLEEDPNWVSVQLQQSSAPKTGQPTPKSASNAAPEPPAAKEVPKR